jgi:heme oxygenase
MLTEKLKEQTRANHQALEKKLVTKMRSMRTVSDYTDILCLFYSFFGGLEKMIKLYLDQTSMPDYKLRRKAGALAADLVELGAMVPAIAHRSALPAIHDHQQALGAMYVIEGSTFGGKIISKMIRQSLPSTEGHGLTFFDGYGDETENMWAQFKHFLTRPENLPGDEMINTANETFSKFSQYFD